MGIKSFQEYLRANRFKFTPTRRLIFEEIFQAQEVHLNAYEIHKSLRKKGRKVSLATIYRTLNLLVQTYLVSEIDLGEAHAHYEPDVHKRGHGHLVCLSCGRVREFSHQKIQGIIAKIGNDNNYQTDKFSIQVFGYCNACQKKY
jgi:Fur family ferric uptake transcriptional regulator